ncbi:MAG: IPT/TIG domain-containing protein, partial [Nitrospirae bacterium]|nr:IPT/TIG domain-containing protein [Nitrospirota bacterium]
MIDNPAGKTFRGKQAQKWQKKLHSLKQMKAGMVTTYLKSMDCMYGTFFAAFVNAILSNPSSIVFTVMRGEFILIITIARTLGIVLSVAMLLGGCGSGKETTAQPADSVAPKLTTISPQEGALGTLVTLTGENFAGNPDDNTVVFRAPAQGTITIKPVTANQEQIRFIMPAAVAETAQISVEVHEKESPPMAFKVLALTDPTPGKPASELTAFYGTLDHTLGDLTNTMETALLPFMEAHGQTAEAARIREGMAKIREGFGESANGKKTTMSAADLAAFDAFFASDAMQQAIQQMTDVSGKLNGPGTLSRVRAARALALDMGSINSGTLEDINDAKNFLKNLRGIMEDLNDALLAAEVAAGGASLIPGAQGAASIIPILEEIRLSIVKPIIGVLDVVITIISAVPTDAVGGTLAVTVVDNNLYMNQGFGSMQNPVPAELNPGHVLVLEPYAVTGTVDFHNDGKSLNQLADDLATEINPVVAGLLELSGFKIEALVLDEVEVRLKLVTDRPDIFSGSWGGSMLRIAAAQPGEGNVTVRADLRQIVEPGEPCPIEEIGIGTGGTCIRAEDLEITRPMRAYSGLQNSGPYTQGGILHTAQVEGLPAGQAYIG